MMKQTEANKAAAAKMTAIKALMSDIERGLRTANDGSWGAVADLSHYESQLSEVADSLLARGEFAPINTLWIPVALTGKI
jgi:hypothetical protein